MGVWIVKGSEPLVKYISKPVDVSIPVVTKFKMCNQNIKNHFWKRFNPIGLFDIILIGRIGIICSKIIFFHKKMLWNQKQMLLKQKWIFNQKKSIFTPELIFPNPYQKSKVSFSKKNTNNLNHWLDNKGKSYQSSIFSEEQIKHAYKSYLCEYSHGIVYPLIPKINIENEK